jgi:hypothetical protein
MRKLLSKKEGSKQYITIDLLMESWRAILSAVILGFMPVE